jgi:hypothetical protein
LDLVMAGAPLREVADTLGLPWWLRKLPAQAFCAPLPALPTDADFGFRIVSLVPKEPRLVAIWLARVSQAYAAGGREYAIWLARQTDLMGPPEELFMYMAAWAWFSERPDLQGHRLLRRRWTPEMSLKRAREEVGAWRQRLRLMECLGPGIQSPWLADGVACGYSFVALRTVHDFIAESLALENCLDQNADQLHAGATAVFSIRKGSRSVACVEIGLHEDEITMPTIVQLRAARNRRAPPEIWQATFAWLGSQRLQPIAPQRHTPRPVDRAEARRQLWRPYLEFIADTPYAEPFRRLILGRARAGRPSTRPRLPAALRPQPARP